MQSAAGRQRRHDRVKMGHVEQEGEDPRVQPPLGRRAEPAAGGHRDRCLSVLQGDQPPPAPVVNRRLRRPSRVDVAKRFQPGQPDIDHAGLRTAPLGHRRPGSRYPMSRPLRGTCCHSRLDCSIPDSRERLPRMPAYESAASLRSASVSAAALLVLLLVTAVRNSAQPSRAGRRCREDRVKFADPGRDLRVAGWCVAAAGQTASALAFRLRDNRDVRMPGTRARNRGIFPDWRIQASL